jgi:pimeloyl-ACP methyl ester carboxylesterase
MVNEDAKLVAERSARWLPDHELEVYADEWGRTTFQGGLNWYRLMTRPELYADTEAWSGAKISVPTIFVAGKKDWGTFQEPGAVEAMEQGESVREGMYRGTVLVEGAGHWVNQEQPQRCLDEILRVTKETESVRV